MEPNFEDWFEFYRTRRSHRFMARPPQPVTSFFQLSEDQQLAVLEAREEKTRLAIEARKRKQ